MRKNRFISKIKHYLEEKEGVRSLMRLQSFLILIFSFIIITWQMIIGQIYIELDILLITASFAPKVWQKYAEARMYVERFTRKEEPE